MSTKAFWPSNIGCIERTRTTTHDIMVKKEYDLSRMEDTYLVYANVGNRQIQRRFSCYSDEYTHEEIGQVLATLGLIIKAQGETI